MMIRRVYRNHSSGAKLISIPRGSDIEENDYVIVKKIQLSAEEPIVLNFDKMTQEFIEYAMKNLNVSREEIIRRAVQNVVIETEPKKKPGRPPTFKKRKEDV